MPARRNGSGGSTAATGPITRALAELAARRPRHGDRVGPQLHPTASGTPAAALAHGRALRRRPRLTRPLVARLRAEDDLVIGENEPYGGHLPGDAIASHAIAHERPNALLELRNDLIETDAGQRPGRRRLAPMLEEAAAAGRV